MREKHLRLLEQLDGFFIKIDRDEKIESDTTNIVDALSKIVNKYGKYIEVLEKEVAILKKDSHPPVFALDDYKDIIKRIKALEKANG